MRVMISIQHPGHVHFFKNAISEIKKDGHDVIVVARKKPLVELLLKQYEISYEILAGAADSFIELAKIQLKYEYQIFRYAYMYEPDIMLSIGEPAVAHVSKVLTIPSILFTDTEHATLSNKLSLPFADRVCTPKAFKNNLGPNHVKYSGYHELAYLHPNRFEPNTEVCFQYGLNPNKKIAVIRLVSWKAAHDIGQTGFADIQSLISDLERSGVQVVISSEDNLPPQLKKYQVNVPPHQIHNLLNCADIFVGESGTMAIESAILGTPAVFVSTLEAGVLCEIESEFGLLTTVSNPANTKKISSIIDGILSVDTIEWQKKRKVLLKNSVDTTSIILDQINEVIQ